MPQKDHEFSKLKKGFKPPLLRAQGQTWELFELHKSWKQIGEKRRREGKKSNLGSRDNQEEQTHNQDNRNQVSREGERGILKDLRARNMHVSIHRSFMKVEFFLEGDTCI